MDVSGSDKLGLMDIDAKTHYLEQLIGLSPKHRLTMSRTQTETRAGSVHKVQWLEEFNEDKMLIARYRSWIRQSQQPPYDLQTGWERFCVNGQLMAREVRYSKRATHDWLH